jgi:predicted ATP-grasp superfamily ATP-dependent carboligase
MDDRIATLDNSVPVVVLKLDRNVFHHGALGVVRSLGRLGVPVHLVHEDVLAPAAASRFVHGRWRWNPGSEGYDRIQAGLISVAERIGRPAVLIPTDDAGAIFLAEHGEVLRRWYLFPSPPRDLPRRLAGKDSLRQLCREHALACPEVSVPRSYDEALDFARRFGFPLLAKLSEPWRRPPGSPLHSSTIVRGPDELAAVFGTAADCTPVLLQEFIAGAGDADWFFHGYRAGESACRPGFTGVKLRSYPVRAGLTTLGRTAANERLRGQVERFVTDLGYRGLLDLDLRWDARDGRFKLLDFNPRLGAQFRLFEDDAGLDVVRAAYLDLTGQPAPEGAATLDRRFLVENYDVLAALAQYWRGGLNLGTWLRSLRHIDETAWFARDDLVPFGLMCLRFGWRAVHRTHRGNGGRRADEPPRYRPGRGYRGGHAVVEGQEGAQSRPFSYAGSAEE